MKMNSHTHAWAQDELDLMTCASFVMIIYYFSCCVYYYGLCSCVIWPVAASLRGEWAK